MRNMKLYRRKKTLDSNTKIKFYSLITEENYIFFYSAIKYSDRQIGPSRPCKC